MSPQGAAKRRSLGRALTELHYRLRTEGRTPARQAAAVGLGCFIGCLPLYGLHLALCVVCARLLSLNRVTTYLAAHVNNPLSAPFLLVAEAGVGYRLRTGQWPRLDPQALTASGALGLGRDLLVGAVVLGVVLGALLGLASFLVSRRWRSPSFEDLLRESAAKRYLESGIFHWEAVRGKLRYDPVYFDLLRSGELPASGRIADLGCGRGILLALVAAARELAAEGSWPRWWPRLPSADLYGLEAHAGRVRVARSALGELASVEWGDVRSAEVPPARAILLIDVLHYLEPEAQERLLTRAAAALEPGGILILREADADRGWRFALTRLQERLSALARGELRRSFAYRGERAWVELLTGEGLEVATRPLWAGTPYANVLISGSKPA